MKLTNLVSGLFYATLTVAHTDFIKDGNRAELFEIMDHEVPEFRVTVPADEFQTIKSEINAGGSFFFKRQWNNGNNNQWGNNGNNNQWGGVNNGNNNNQWGNTGNNNNQWGNTGNNNNQWGNTGNNNNQWGGNNGGNNQWGGNNGGNNQWGGNNGGNNQWGGMGNWGGNGGGGFGFSQKENYKTKNATMIVNINGTQKSFDKVTFKIGGSSSRSYARQAFNLKIRGKDDLYGRKQFRIRSDAREATYLRSKLACDMHNRLGLTSISANYITLYVNNEYWGFYVLMDSPKLTWAEIEYGDKDSTHLYKCKSGGLALSSNNSNCENENEEVTDQTDWRNFISSLDRANSASEADNIFEVDQFLYEMAYEYLVGSWDHYLNTGHNFSVYKKPDNYGGKWIMIHYDFDGDFGQDVCAVEFAGSVKADKDYPSWSFDDWCTKNTHLLEILIQKDRTRFNKVMKRFVEEAFNPDVLFPRIDELKDFIRPYVKRDKTPDSNGKKPGMLNEKVNNDYTMEQWDANSEFTNLGVSSSSSAYGLKYWILNRYRKVCKDFSIDCNREYLDLNYYYDIDRSVEGPINTQFMMGGFGFGGGQQQNNTPRTTQSQPPKPANYTPTTRRTTTTTRRTTTTSYTSNKTNCVAASLGYPCCSSWNTEVFYQDENGDWGVENDDWCGITKASVPQCWSEKLGFPCCNSCIPVVYSDEDGNWGVENDDWCGLATYC